MMPALLGTVPMQLLGGLGVSPVDTFLLTYPKPSSGNVADFLAQFPTDERAALAKHLINEGVPAETVSSALSWLDAKRNIKLNWSKIHGVLAITSAAVSAYHGYRRNQSIPWAIWWFFAGSILPVFTPVIAIAQGYGKSKKAS
jgi:hypothetical protein